MHVGAALQAKYPNYDQEGFLAFASSLPVIYVLDCGTPDRTKREICKALCLPLQCVRVLCSKVTDKAAG